MRQLGLMIGAAILATAGAATAQNVKTGVDAWGRGDYKAAVEQWRGPALAGNADAQFNLGQAYKLGRGVPVDPGLAESWFRKAALQGHFQAEDNYGLALFTAGCKAEAVPWLEKSVARGEPRGQLVLGTMLFNGDGVARDYPRAYALMTLAQQAGLKSAAETLAQMDQYISAEDRQRGTQLARDYASRPKPMPQLGGGRAIARADAAPTRVPPSVRPAPPPRTPRTAAPTTAPAPRVVEARTPPPTTPRALPARQASGGNWRVQLGAFSSQDNASAQWNKVRARLGSAQPVYARAGSVIRLQAGGFASKAEAQRACSASGVSCVVVAP